MPCSESPIANCSSPAPTKSRRACIPCLAPSTHLPEPPKPATDNVPSSAQVATTHSWQLPALPAQAPGFILGHAKPSQDPFPQSPHLWQLPILPAQVPEAGCQLHGGGVDGQVQVHSLHGQQGQRGSLCSLVVHSRLQLAQLDGHLEDCALCAALSHEASCSRAWQGCRQVSMLEQHLKSGINCAAMSPAVQSGCSTARG